MTTDDMKAAIERAMSEGMANQREWWLICELAEVGRLAVAERRTYMDDKESYLAWDAAKRANNSAADAFLAKHGGGE